MAFADDDRPRPPSSHIVGCDISSFSIEELTERISLLKSEIARLEADMKKKADERRAADSLFRL